MIVRVSGRDELFAEGCRLASEHGRFRIAWCGWPDSASNQIVPVAKSGEGCEFVTRISVGSAPETEALVAAAIRLRQPAVCNDLQSDPARVCFREEMLARGYRSIVALPLTIECRSVGCLVLISDE